MGQEGLHPGRAGMTPELPLGREGVRRLTTAGSPVGTRHLIHPPAPTPGCRGSQAGQGRGAVQHGRRGGGWARAAARPPTRFLRTRLERPLYTFMPAEGARRALLSVLYRRAVFVFCGPYTRIYSYVVVVKRHLFYWQKLICKASQLGAGRPPPS